MATVAINYDERLSRLFKRRNELEEEFTSALSKLIPISPEKFINFEEAKVQIAPISNNFFITNIAISILNFIKENAPIYVITFDELKPFYDFNNSLSRRQAVDFIFNEAQNLIGNDLHFNYLLIKNGSVQIYS